VQGYPFANWDTTAFPEPERFDVQRKERNHLAFGTGPTAASDSADRAWRLCLADLIYAASSRFIKA
jgi:hypothetical protein